MSAPPIESAYGRIVAACDVERVLLDVILKWLPSYLAELDRQQGQPAGTLPQPRGWVLSSEIEKMPEDQLPTLIVTSPGTLAPPMPDGAGRYVARWALELAMYVSARGNRVALKLARQYAAALRALVLQQQPDDELPLRRIDWLGERYGELPSIDDRTVCIATVDLAVEVADVLTRHAGPIEPLLLPEPTPDPDSPTWPTADTVDVSIANERLT